MTGLLLGQHQYRAAAKRPLSAELQSGRAYADRNVTWSWRRPIAGLAGQLIFTDSGQTILTVTKFFRADSACYDQTVLSYLRHQEIGFAVSADMSTSLRATIAALPEKAWKPHDEGRQFAEVLFVPSTSLFEPNEIQADRYIAVRKKPRQLTLWEQDGYSYSAVVTNLPWRAKKTLEWHRGDHPCALPTGWPRTRAVRLALQHSKQVTS